MFIWERFKRLIVPLLTILGYRRTLLRRPVPFLRAFVPIALAFYLFHRTIAVMLGWIGRHCR